MLFLPAGMKKKSPISQFQLADHWMLSLREAGGQKDQPAAAGNLFLAEQLVEELLACRTPLSGLGRPLFH